MAPPFSGMVRLPAAVLPAAAKVLDLDTGTRSGFAKSQGASAEKLRIRRSNPTMISAVRIAARNRADAPIRGLRFHDLCHQAITELAEAGVRIRF
jgi:hypothetical protein